MELVKPFWQHCVHVNPMLICSRNNMLARWYWYVIHTGCVDHSLVSIIMRGCCILRAQHVPLVYLLSVIMRENTFFTLTLNLFRIMFCTLFRVIVLTCHVMPCSCRVSPLVEYVLSWYSAPLWHSHIAQIVTVMIHHCDCIFICAGI